MGARVQLLYDTEQNSVIPNHDPISPNLPHLPTPLPNPVPQTPPFQIPLPRPHRPDKANQQVILIQPQSSPQFPHTCQNNCEKTRSNQLPFNLNLPTSGSLQ